MYTRWLPKHFSTLKCSRPSDIEALLIEYVYWFDYHASGVLSTENGMYCIYGKNFGYNSTNLQVGKLLKAEKIARQIRGISR